MSATFNATRPWPEGGHQRTAAIRALPPSAAKTARNLSPEMHVDAEPTGLPAAGAIEPAAWPLPALRAMAEEETAADGMLQAQSDILAVVAHELRNALMPIRLAAAQLGNARKDELSLPRLRVAIERQLDHVARLVGDLLDISRPGSGRARLERVQVDMRQVVAEALDACRPSMEARGQQLHLDLPAVLPAVDGDPVRLAQVVRNLLDNASKYSPSGARIDMAVAATDDTLAMTVSDNGIGITAAVLPHVFERFVQDPHAVAFNGAGLGIGLSVVREWVQAHGGQVAAHSAGRGRGSQFIVTLPLARRAPAAAAGDAAGPGSGGAGRARPAGKNPCPTASRSDGRHHRSGPGRTSNLLLKPPVRIGDFPSRGHEPPPGHSEGGSHRSAKHGGNPVSPSDTSVSQPAPVDEDMAAQARPGYGIPSQDPRPGAQSTLSAEESEREEQSVLTGGGMVAGAATGATIGVMVAGPVGVLVGGTVGAVAGALGGAAAGSMASPAESASEPAPQGPTAAATEGRSKR